MHVERSLGADPPLPKKTDFFAFPIKKSLPKEGQTLAFGAPMFRVPEFGVRGPR